MSTGRRGSLPTEYFLTDKPKEAVKEWSEKELLEMWPQAVGELRGFRRVLEAKAGITAAQLGMALQLAEERYAQIKK